MKCLTIVARNSEALKGVGKCLQQDFPGLFVLPERGAGPEEIAKLPGDVRYEFLSPLHGKAFVLNMLFEQVATPNDKVREFVEGVRDHLNEVGSKWWVGRVQTVNGRAFLPVNTLSRKGNRLEA